MQLLIRLGDQAIVEASGAERIGRRVECFDVENFTRLLSPGMAEVVIVGFDLGHVSAVARNNICFALNGSL